MNYTCAYLSTGQFERRATVIVILPYSGVPILKIKECAFLKIKSLKKKKKKKKYIYIYIYIYIKFKYIYIYIK